MKKLASLILALAMCFALGAPAFATEQTGNLTTELSSLLPELKLTLPEASTIILNPYRNTVKDEVATANVGIDKGDKLQIMNGVFSITSTTTSKVHVSATVSGSVGGNAEFATAAVAPGTGGHKVYLTLTYAITTGATAAAPAPDKLSNATNVKAINDTEQTLTWDLPAFTGTGNNAANSTQRVDMQFGGSCSDSPSADDGPWAETDTVSAAFVFTATPVTDDPMITTVFQATDNTPTYPAEYPITTTKPSDFKSGSGKITKIEYSAPGANSLTNLEDTSNDKWGGSTWDGTKITLKCAANSNAVGGIFGKDAAVKIVKITLEYTDSTDTNVTHVLTYTLKVNVLEAPAAQQQQQGTP